MHSKHILAFLVASAALVAAGCAAQSESAPAPAPAPAPSAAPPAPAPAAGAAAAIEQRQAAMRQAGGAARALGGLAAASPPDVNAIRAQGQILAQVAGQLPGLFPAGSGPDSGTPTRASPAIWTNAAGFSEQVRNFNTAAQAVANASTPEAAAAAARGVGAACQSCHSQFRTQ